MATAPIETLNFLKTFYSVEVIQKAKRQRQLTPDVSYPLASMPVDVVRPGGSWDSCEGKADG